MSTFGEALVGAFNSTYGNVTRARLLNEQARALRDETDAIQRQREEVRAAQVRHGLLNPDGSTNDPGAGPSAPSVLAAPNPQASVNPNAGQVPGAQPASAPPAPTQPPAPSPLARPPVPASAPAPAPASAPAPAPAPAPAALPPVPTAQAPAPSPAQAPQGGSPRGVVAQAAQQVDQGQVQPVPALQPPIPREVVERAAKVVERNGNNPVDAMIVAGAMAPPAQRVPGVGTPADYIQRLVQEIRQHRGEGQTGPLTRANYNAYLRDVTLAAQRNLSPAQQVQALAVVDRIRTAGLQRFTGLAIAAAQAGDMEGAARALNGASNFNPDGFQDMFRAVPGGIEMVRRPEPGERGEPQRVVVGQADIVRYATAMMDPTWSLNHFLQVRGQEETERTNRAREALEAARIGESRASRNAIAGERRAAAAADAALARAWLAYSNARENGAPPEELRRLQDAYHRAATADGVTAAGIARVETLDRQRAAAAEARQNRAALSPARIAEAQAAEEEALIPQRGETTVPPARIAAVANARSVMQVNPNMPARVAISILEQMAQEQAARAAAIAAGRTPPVSSFRESTTTPGVFRGPNGVTFRLPEELRPSSTPRTGGSAGVSTNPPAPIDNGGRNQTMVRTPSVIEESRRRNNPTVDEWVADNAYRNVSERELSLAAYRFNVDARELRRRLDAERNAGSDNAR